MYQKHSFEVFQRYFKKDTKVWFPTVKLIYCHSLLHNIISNQTGGNAHVFITLKIQNKYNMLNAWLRNCRSILAFMKKEIKDQREIPEGKCLESFLIVSL